MTTTSTDTPILFFSPSFIDRVKAATDDSALCRALERRDVDKIEERFRFQLLERPQRNAQRFLRIRNLYDEYRELRKQANK